METAREVFDVLSAVGVLVGLIALVRSNRRLGQSLRLNTLQQMITEMNELRRFRAEDPAMERTLFTDRAGWDDLRIKRHIYAVQMANIFEWAYLARRCDLLEADVWRSWTATWRDVIFKSQDMRATFTDTVWTFGRDPEVARELTKLVQDTGQVADPMRRSVLDRLVGY